MIFFDGSDHDNMSIDGMSLNDKINFLHYKVDKIRKSIMVDEYDSYGVGEIGDFIDSIYNTVNDTNSDVGQIRGNIPSDYSRCGCYNRRCY